MVDFLAALAGGLASGGVLMIVLLVARRLWAARHERERRGREARVGPLALALLGGENSEGIEALGAEDRAALGTLLARYGRSVSGESLERIAEFCEREGLVDRALEALTHRRAWRRARAAFSLGDMASRRAAPALLVAVTDDRREVRAAAVRSLGRLGVTSAAEPLALALAEGTVPRAIVAQALLGLGCGAAPRLRALAGHQDASVRAAAAELLGLVGEAADARVLTEMLCDPAAEVRAGAAQALGRIGAEDAVRELRGALSDRIPFVRTQAAHALGTVGAAEAELTAQARERPYDPAHAAAQALARGAPAALERAARHPDASTHLLEAADLMAVRGS